MTDRLSVERTQCVVMGELAPGPRARLVRQLFDLWGTYFQGLDLETFERLHFVDTTVVGLAHGAGGDLAGFGYFNRTHLDVKGRTYLVLGGGTFNRLEYASLGTLSIALFREVARLRLRHPTVPMVGISVATNPIIYDSVERLLAITAPRVGFEPPPHAIEIAQIIARRRGMILDPVDPWLVKFYARPAQAARIRASRRYAEQTAAIQTFEARVPHWEDGQALLTWAPLSAQNIARSVKRLVAYRRTHG